MAELADASVPATAAATTASPAVLDVIQAFDRGYPAARLRVWQREGSRRERIYPPGETDAGANRGPSRTLSICEGTSLEIEVSDAAPAAAVELLTSALGAVLRYESEARSAARELAERYEEINLLYSISEVLGTVVSLDAAAHRILSEVADVLAARRASLWVLDAAEPQLRLAATVGEQGLSGPIPIDDPDSVTARVFRERQALNLERGRRLPGGTPQDPRPRAHEAFLSVPVNFTPRGGRSRTVGVITLVGRRTDAPFSAGDARLLAAIASQVGAALETHRLIAENVGRERVERELELAHDLQLKLLPETADFESIAAVAARCVPAESVGGDFYHLFRLAGGRIGVMIGDVSGHGFSAALIMAMVMGAAAVYAQEGGSPGDVIRRLHGVLVDELETTEMHLSLFYGVLDPVARRLTYANAGHPQAFCVGASGPPRRLGATDPPVGTVAVEDYAEATVPWVPGDDLLLLFTDGLADAFADEHGAGGEANLLDAVVRLREQPPARILDALFQRVGRTDSAVPQDDRTALLLRI